MENNKMLFTAGQFARIHNINKRTLHYYDEIGLFSPDHIGENGYRYYTYLQSPTLEAILTLRELGMSIKEIGYYFNHKNMPMVRQMLSDKMAEIDTTIKHLNNIRQYLQQKDQTLAFCQQVDLDSMAIVECQEESLLLSGPISGAYDDNDVAVLVEHMLSLGDSRLYSKSYGSMISVDKILAGNFGEYDCFFTKLLCPIDHEALFCRPAGQYLRAFCKGDWDKLPETYERMLAYSSSVGLRLKGFAYEEGINEMAIQQMDEYVTQIMILCE